MYREDETRTCDSTTFKHLHFSCHSIACQPQYSLFFSPRVNSPHVLATKLSPLTMVLFSEYVAASAILITFITVFIDFALTALTNDVAVAGTKIKIGFGGESLYLIMILSYSAVRVLLESESPQSVVPVYLAIIAALVTLLPSGKRSAVNWFGRCFTFLLMFAALQLFIIFKGLVSLSIFAQQHPLDREITWYHTILIHFSSYRSWIILVVAFIPQFSGGWGLFIAAVRILLIWVLTRATGNSVAKSPWGLFDEIMLENTVLLTFLLAVITCSIAIDALQSFLCTSEEIPDQLDWQEFRNKIAGFFRTLEAGETHEESDPISSAANAGDENPV